MPENIDIDTSDILYGETTIEDMGKRLLDEVIAVAAGKRTAAERLGHNELHLHYMVQEQRSCNC